MDGKYFLTWSIALEGCNNCHKKVLQTQHQVMALGVSQKKKSHGFGLVVKVAQIILRSYRNLNFEDIMKSDNLNSIVCKFGVGYGIEKNPVDICYS
jgi:hypothetical protein